MTTVLESRSVNLDAAAATRLPGDLFSVATLLDGHIRNLDNVGLMESYNCIDVGLDATFPCPASMLSAPTQTAPSTAASGGTLPDNTTYRAKITAINSRGETIPSGEQSQATGAAAGNDSTVTWNWNAVAGATGYRVYLTNGAAGTQDRYVQVGAVTTYVMTAYPPAGAVLDTPPTINTAVVPVSKTFDGPNWQDAFSFAAYTGMVCKSFNGIDADRLRAVFEATESRAVENALIENRMVDGGTLIWDAATDLTPAGGATTPEIGLALLEGHASAHYAAIPTMHIPRTVASLLAKNNALDTSGAIWTTQLGSKVAAGSGYEENNGPTGAAPAAGEWWLYASGQVTVERGAVHAVDEWKQTTNEEFVLFERAYRVTVDCYTAAVRVEVHA